MAEDVSPGLRAWAESPGGRAVLDALRERGRRGASLERGRLSAVLTEAQRNDVGRLLGTRWALGVAPVRVEHLAGALAEHGLDVPGFLEALDGAPVVPRRVELAAARARRDAEKVQAVQTLIEAGVDATVATAWATHPVTPVGGDGALAHLAAQVGRVWQHLPHGGNAVRLAELATLVTRANAHALDRDTLPGRATVLLLALVQGAEYPTSPSAWRRRWAQAGVWCDTISSRALVLNLPVRGTAPVAALATATPGEPVWLTLRSLAGDWSVAPPGDGGRTVFVCENPTVVEAAADRLGSRCPPLISTDGVPTQAVLDLVAAVARAGFTIKARADFDGRGADIVRLLATVAPDLRPWRFTTADYTAAGGALADASLPPAPLLRREDITNSVHEEVLLAQLIEDLRDAAAASGLETASLHRRPEHAERP